MGLQAPGSAVALLVSSRAYSTRLAARVLDMGAHEQRTIQRWIAATNHTVAGLASAWRSEAAFRQEVSVILILIPVAVWLAKTPGELVWLIGSGLLVLIVELLNTAIEYTLDRIGTERHELAGRAKDMGSAAVFLSLTLWTFSWGAVVWNRLTA